MTGVLPDRMPGAGSDTVDHGLVRAIRREIAEKLAAQLQATPVADATTRQELCRALLADELSRHTRARLAAGQPGWTVEEEFALADGVMSALFGLGRLQPLIDDPGIENIEINGCDQVWLSYADGREERAARGRGRPTTS